MQEALGGLVYAPWIYVLIALSVLLDVFLPVLPSGVIVVAAATVAAGATATSATGLPAPYPGALPPQVCAVLLCATTASVLGDLVVYRLAWHGSARFDRAVARSRRLASAQARLGHALARGGGALIVLARFAPAGRSVMSLAAGAARRRVREFLPWSALAGLVWAAYGVGLGYVGGQWLGASWLGTTVPVLALFAAGGLAARLIRRGPVPDRAGQDAPAPNTPWRKPI
ncbi:MAG TPA: VTT domain-containing protein [Streptomyces sp.]|nr:VTT domain-containing protein [Streptomyces sp.]